MGSWQARDVAGIILLLLVLTEGGRKWVSVADLSRSQAKEIESSHDPDIHQIARRLLTPARPGSHIPALCQTPEPECGDDVSVKCTQGSLVGCDCDFIQLCYPHVSGCTRFNSTHTMSCGF